MKPYAERLRQLYQLAKRGARLDLVAMRAACEALGNPQDRLLVAHIAGTNGKGSVAAMLESIARHAGLRTGLYTSPHLCQFVERIRIDGIPVPHEWLAETLGDVLDRFESLSFFEVSTLAAFMMFAQSQIDLTVIEVGLGGRLDATNVVRQPRATAITTISYDHMDWLGDSIELIAFAKSGVIKPKSPVILGDLPVSALTVVERDLHQAALLPQQVWRLGVDLLAQHKAPDVVISGPQGRCVSVRPSLVGAHQRVNASIAAGLAWMLRAPSDDAPSLAIEDIAIAKGIANTDWPGRLETIESKDGLVLLDGAHNEEGVRALGAHLDSLTQPPDKRAMVFGAMATKAWGNMVRELHPRFGHRFYVEPKVQGRDAVDIWHLIDVDGSGVPIDSVREALKRARESVGPEGIVVVTGSLYLVGQVRSMLLAIASDETIGM